MSWLLLILGEPKFIQMLVLQYVLLNILNPLSYCEAIDKSRFFLLSLKSLRLSVAAEVLSIPLVLILANILCLLLYTKYRNKFCPPMFMWGVLKMGNPKLIQKLRSLTGENNSFGGNQWFLGHIPQFQAPLLSCGWENRIVASWLPSFRRCGYTAMVPRSLHSRGPCGLV